MAVAFCHVLFLCCSVCFLYRPFCHRALKLDMSTLLTIFFLNNSSIYMYTIYVVLYMYFKAAKLTKIIGKYLFHTFNCCLQKKVVFSK